ncbi:hypothetical protein AVEN_123201-1 [Araneus ventricosus]|uniref:Uncharacterized protein n=1 Tax=Araneus ventricosus TaxID=182803 RepID=A0A4Y2GU78_ARAVE|nr:hypothetical protein AVEN_123201-1 [Araneus ventricosus]
MTWVKHEDLLQDRLRADVEIGVRMLTPAGPEKDLKQGPKVAFAPIMWAHIERMALSGPFREQQKAIDMSSSLMDLFFTSVSAPIPDQEALDCTQKNS